MAKRIQFLTYMFCNSEGEIVRVKQETDTELYYYDGCGRWCFVRKEDEGTEFRILTEDDK